jgi:SUMO ligase MMS21 Smc5/6 complex component
MPSLKDLIPRGPPPLSSPPVILTPPTEAGDADSSDEDIEIGGATQDFKCPLTLQRLAHPMVSRVCKHAYSRAAILEFLGPGGGAKKCPASGCGHMVGRADLAEDQGLARRVRDAARREEDRAERARGEKGADETLDVDIDDDDE